MYFSLSDKKKPAADLRVVYTYNIRIDKNGVMINFVTNNVKDVKMIYY